MEEEEEEKEEEEEEGRRCENRDKSQQWGKTGGLILAC